MPTPVRLLQTAADRRRPGARAIGGYVAALALVALATAAARALEPVLDGGNLAMVFQVAVLVSAVGFGLGPALLAALAAAVVYNFAFLSPRYSFEIGHPADLLTFSMFFAVALATGWLAGRVRDNARVSARQADTVGALLEASRTLSAAATPDQAAQALAAQATAAAGAITIVLLPAEDGLRIAGGPTGLEKLSPDGAAAARRVWESGETSDAETGWTFRALQGLRERVGVVGLRGLAPDAEGRVSALLEQGAVALERAQLASAAAENEALRRADQLRSALLNSISHDFRTPLSSVLGSATTLLEFGTDLKPAVRRDLLESIAEDARRLNRYVGELLDMGRLEAGALRPRRSWTDAREVLNAAVERLGERLGRRKIVRDFARDLSKVRTDPVLLEQALLNILDNAAAYAPEGSRIEIAAHEDLANVLITIEDEGPGIPADALDRVFDKFRRLQAPSDRGEGLGLGLSIARGFIEAMGGRIAVASPVADGRGSRFLIALPKAVPTAKELL
ncbi:DUF4118 domain-containing protein [Caulobacter sp. 17J80-11]|uniref:DUF4118 domain-containing protein n=1 Tax=Caulobacter sp. 17J80-11 TaxID=2763502 RepID=UPI001653CAF9|nr:DUF4118 domain-containing protein [Caulobacter sp. 17J80-11]MBC6981274.1 DUF4118 domain-containing protein [Caulobacter sp. 17J80-11]